MFVIDSLMEPKQPLGKIIFTSSLGTLIEWYDFYIFGMLARIISTQFFPKGNETAALLSTLAIFAAGFLVRPFGALVFGRLGDLIGRKYTFLLTLILMGGSTFLIGCVPSYATIGMAAPVLVLLLRVVQGLALGGEYGGAATYVAEYAPVHQRGYYTSWIQTTATLGLFMSLGVIMLVKTSMSNVAFEAEWGGWRYPFWMSIVLVGVSIYIRMKMEESPLFSRLKQTGNTSKNPIRDSFGKKANFKMVLLALFGAVMGEGVIWYTSQFYAQYFLENAAKLDFMQSREIMLWAIALATPFFLFFGWLSDRVGRKWIMLLGMLGGVLFYRPIFSDFMQRSDISPAVTHLHKPGNPATVKQVDFIKQDTIDQTHIITQTKTHWLLPNGITFTEKRADTLVGYQQGAAAVLKKDQHPVIGEKVLPSSTQWRFTIWVWCMILFVTMAYGPIAAFLVELFPTRIRYTSMSLPYHIGNGVFGGLVPFIATLLAVTFPRDPLVGLWYPIGIAALCFLIGAIYLPSKQKTNVHE